jgi:hypothetical protein
MDEVMPDKNPNPRSAKKKAPKFTAVIFSRRIAQAKKPVINGSIAMMMAFSLANDPSKPVI